jgi:carboxypeptidase Q
MKFIVSIFALTLPLSLSAQSADESTIRQIFDKALTEGKAYSDLDYLSNRIGQRLSGSPGAASAVEWTKQVMKDAGFDSVWLQPVMVPHWVRGQKEIGRIQKTKTRKAINLNLCALGGSVGTGPDGITGSVVEVKSFEELAGLGASVKDKIVFFNRPMDPTKINTFAAYGGAVNQRGGGASEAAKYGAKAVLVRSMGSNVDNYPHTGGLRYAQDLPKIPAFALSTRDAEMLASTITREKSVIVYLESHCEMLEDAPSFNVVGEIKGGEYRDEIIAIGGHLDSWDLGQGAHDDGAGCVQAIDILRIFRSMGYKPKRTIRAVMFMNEENGLRGGQKYAELALKNNEKHLAAIESDRGGFTPRGFTISTDSIRRKRIQSWKPLLESYGLADFSQEGGGADIGPLGPQGVALIGFLPDSQRYFTLHHTAADTFDKVDKRELEMGAASMAALVYLLDQHGLK